MHIPDGYLSPQTCAVAFAVAVPVVVLAGRHVQRVVKTRHVPLLAVLAAVSFLIMMFNIPVPDGTSAHAVGGAMIAILLGPWAAVIAVTVALLFQALLFGDGGVLVLGANTLNMAIILPFAGYAVYRLLAGRSALSSRRRLVAAAVAGYIGINAAALATAVELGIQPDLFHTAAGAPLYSPYHLAQTIPAMLAAHMLVAGFAEAALTAGVFAYLVRTDPGRLAANHRSLAAPIVREAAGETDASAAADVYPVGRAVRTETRYRKHPSLPGRPRRLHHRARLVPGKIALAAVALLAVLTPVGLLAPGGAFGEDAPAALPLGSLGLSAVPAGLARYNGLWSHALLADYGFAGGQNPVLGYLLSAAVGIAVVGSAVYILAVLVRTIGNARTRRAADIDAARHLGPVGSIDAARHLGPVGSIDADREVKPARAACDVRPARDVPAACDSAPEPR